VRTWADETHYSVLGVSEDATQAEIRTAYLNRSKEFHPDYNVGKDEGDSEEIHNKFVKINAAYSVLGNKKERRLYDLQILMRDDPRWKGEQDVKDAPHAFRREAMSYEERIQSMGYAKPDPDFYAKHGNYHKKVVLCCVAFIFVGLLVQGSAIIALYNRHTAQLDAVTLKNNAMLVQARDNARNFSTVQEQLDSLNLQPSDKKTKALPFDDLRTA